jgi:peptidoglycan/xylan/chitin deacetylase (PgdA/CDA1 family)
MPILRRHGVPAVVFVATGYMDSHETYWYDRLVHWMLEPRQAELPLPGGVPALRVQGDETERRQVAYLALKHLKQLPDAARRETLERWRAAMGAPAHEAFVDAHGPMSWQQVRALSDAGIEIGSHSVSHPVLANVTDDAQLERELFDSKAQIEARTGRNVVSLAYPVGGPGAYSDRVVAVARRAGYRFGFTYESGVIDPRHMDEFRLRRLAIERYVSRERFRALLAMPPLFA